ncbi:MAG: hypothetical protein K2X48_05820 [Chitinophagaceae bacterium]|nr:hypothetical protein [Chitinophagaceae bacterium]
MILLYKRFRIGNDIVSFCIVALLLLGGLHAVVSFWRMDKLYYYLRNLVIVYSMFSFFAGYYLLKYLPAFIKKIKKILQVYIIFFLFAPVSQFFFERFGVATLFPAVLKKNMHGSFPVLISLNIIYAITYSSSTAMLIACFYILVLLSPGYKFFVQLIAIGFVLFAGLFIYLMPNLNLINEGYTIYNQNPIYRVIESHPLLSIDGNSTWRLVLWNQVLAGHFPGNIAGIGFGTPLFDYFPVYEIEKFNTLPYVVGAHNSYIYLFGRMGIVYLFITIVMYNFIIREYFYYKSFYYHNGTILVFWSFFAISLIAFFNPVLESPIFSGSYWLVLGFLAKAIHNRIYMQQQIS